LKISEIELFEMITWKLKHYKTKTPFCGKCGKMISNKNAEKSTCYHCGENL